MSSCISALAVGACIVTLLIVQRPEACIFCCRPQHALHLQQNANLGAIMLSCRVHVVHHSRPICHTGAVWKRWQGLHSIIGSGMQEDCNVILEEK